MYDKHRFQPLLPRISMRWFFVLALIVAGALTWLLRSSYQEDLVLVLIAMSLGIVAFLTLSAVFFGIAFLVGAVEKIIVKKEDAVESPFATESMPPQIIPPTSKE